MDGDPPTFRLGEFGTLHQIRANTTFRDDHFVRQYLAHGEICLLNAVHPVHWRLPKGRPLLWQFQLHYHEFLLPLSRNVDVASTNGSKNLQLIETTLSSWIDENPVSHSACRVDAWHPYCISRRLPVWFGLITLDALNPELRRRMIRCAHDQARYLSRNLEWGLKGNHLLENLRALGLAGCFFDDGDAATWRSQVERILPKQIREQILEHGEHFERSPMYHCQVFGNFLEIMIAGRNVWPTIYDRLKPVAIKMFGLLAEIVHPDGEIPLFGDSCFGEAPSVACLGQLAAEANIECPETTTMSDKNHSVALAGPYWVFRDQNDYLIFDRGLAGAPTLPAHAHCDLLTLESSIGGTRWLVDSGICNYEDDPTRWYTRSSMAHNVACVEDQNQFDIWSKFRMGYRGKTSNLQQGHEGEFYWSTASHNAYRRFGLNRMSRLIGVQKRRFWYCIDRSTNSTKKRISGFLHLGSDVGITPHGTNCFLLNIGNSTFQLSFFGVRMVQLVEGRYCSEFGIQTKNVVVEYLFDHSSVPAAGWLLWKDETNSDPAPANATLQVNHKNGQEQVAVMEGDQIVHTFTWNSAQ